MLETTENGALCNVCWTLIGEPIGKPRVCRECKREESDFEEHDIEPRKKQKRGGKKIADPWD